MLAGGSIRGERFSLSVFVTRVRNTSTIAHEAIERNDRLCENSAHVRQSHHEREEFIFYPFVLSSLSKDEDIWFGSAPFPA